MRIVPFLPEYFDEISVALKSGVPVILPTDTSYGFSGSIFSDKSITQVEAIKGRENKPFISLVCSNVEMSKFVNTQTVQDLEIFTNPQSPTTFLLPRKNTLLSHFFPDFSELAFRVPLYNPLLGFLEFFGEPVFSTSANFSGKPPLYTRRDIVEMFSSIDRILFVDAGDLERGDSSRIVRVKNTEVVCLR